MKYRTDEEKIDFIERVISDYKNGELNSENVVSAISVIMDIMYMSDEMILNFIESLKKENDK